MKHRLARFAGHLRWFLFFYASGAIAVGWTLGIAWGEVARAYQAQFGVVMNVLVFLMIYPMMIGLDLEQLPTVLARPHPIVLSLLNNFVAAPVLSFGLAKFLYWPPELALGFDLVMLGSSAPTGSAISPALCVFLAASEPITGHSSRARNTAVASWRARTH